MVAKQINTLIEEIAVWYWTNCTHYIVFFSLLNAPILDENLEIIQ